MEGGYVAVVEYLGFLVFRVEDALSLEETLFFGLWAEPSCEFEQDELVLPE